MRTSKYTKLDPVFKRRWVNALRKFEREKRKITGTLYEREYKDDKETTGKDKFCALGVAYYVAYEGKNLEQIDGESDLENPHWSCVPKELRENSETQERIMNMNDGNGATGKKIKPKGFGYIAAWIEKNL